MRRLLRMKRTVVALTAMLAAGATAAVAFGASPHFEHGSTITCNVTSGTNTVTFPQGGGVHTVRGWDAVNGYDLASGVGTIDAAQFVPELVAAVGGSHH